MAAASRLRKSPSDAVAGLSLEADDVAGDAEFDPTRGAPRDTMDAEAIVNSQRLGPSVRGKPIGMPKTVRIMLEEGAENEIPPTGQTVSLNGKAYLIRPGEEVNVPQGVVEILDNAVMSVPIKDPQTMKVVGFRKRLRFPYRKL